MPRLMTVDRVLELMRAWDEATFAFERRTISSLDLANQASYIAGNINDLAKEHGDANGLVEFLGWVAVEGVNYQDQGSDVRFRIYDYFAAHKLLGSFVRYYYPTPA